MSHIVRSERTSRLPACLTNNYYKSTTTTTTMTATTATNTSASRSSDISDFQSLPYSSPSPPQLCVYISHRICANLKIESRAGCGGQLPLCPPLGATLMKSLSLMDQVLVFSLSKSLLTTLTNIQSLLS